jgi:hypothetical protein
MAEIHFFMTQADTLDFAGFLVREFECRFTMDGSDMPDLPELTTAEQVATCRAPGGYTPRFFVTSRRWSRYPLIVRKISHHDGRIRWYVDQRYGGPAFDFVVSAVREEDGSLQILPGSFMDYPWYYIQHGDYSTFDRPATMTSAFQAVRRYMRRNAVQSRLREPARAGPWALPGAVREYQSGCWLRQGDWRFNLLAL